MTETALVVVACLVMGPVVGSFLTVVAHRVPQGDSIVSPPSACDACGTRLGARDLVPIVSWLLARGRCRHCGERIGVEPLVIELTTTAVFVAFGLRFGASVELMAFCVLGASLVALSAIDLRTTRLPREITYTAIAISAPILAAAALVGDEPQRIIGMLVGAVLAFGIMGAIHVAARGGMGDGDVRLAPLLGLHLGWLNPGIVPVGLFFGFLLGAVVGVAIMATRRGDRRTAVPFGPFLAAGAVLAVFVGQAFVDLVLQR